jgi:hypothetical protein
MCTFIKMKFMLVRDVLHECIMQTDVFDRPVDWSAYLDGQYVCMYVCIRGGP